MEERPVWTFWTPLLTYTSKKKKKKKEITSEQSLSFEINPKQMYADV